MATLKARALTYPPLGRRRRSDSNLVLAAFAAKVYGELPLWKELEARGYDLNTLKFSIRKKTVAEQGEQEGLGGGQ
ncbi:hypothetical protein ACVIGB_000818 [Bradyrhizobium sp. USDA 4341]